MTPFFAYRSFNPELDTVRAFAGFGVDTVCIYPANTVNSFGMPYSVYDPTWIGPDQYEFAPLDRQLADLRAAHPRARVICMVDLNTPLWWVRRNWQVGDSFSELGRVAADERWRRDARAYLEAFLRHVESRQADAVFAYVLTAGSTSEWQDRSQGEESAARRAAFRAWSVEQGFPDPVDIPPASVRQHVSHDLLRDPETDALALRYWRFCQWQIGETILYFARAAREIVGRRAALGVFYGYVTLGTSRLLSEGHLDYERVARAPELDFLIAPAKYDGREVGLPGGFNAPAAAFQHQGKLFVQELDHRTHTARPPPGYKGYFGVWKTEAETIAGLRREFAFALTHGAAIWWFDMWGGFYDAPRVRADLAAMKGLWDRCQARGDRPVAQIAVVADPESALYLDESNPRIADFYTLLHQRLGIVGASYRFFSFGDLETLDLAAYRLVYFPACFVMNDTRRRLLAQRVCCDGRTVLWAYRPGVIADGRYDEAAVERLTGLPAGAPRLAERPMDGWTSVLAPDPAIPASDLRAIAQRAGVHCYSDTNEPLVAADHVLAVHTATGGRRRFVLPRRARTVTDALTGRVVARDTAAFETTLTAPETAIYEIEWADERTTSHA